MGEEMKGELSAYVEKDPSLVLSILDPILLDRNVAWMLGGSAVLNSFPVEMLKGWIRQNGVDAARVLANHMPSPHLDKSGNPVVPPLTEFVGLRGEAIAEQRATMARIRRGAQ